MRGRQKGKKKKLVAVEIVDKKKGGQGIGRAYAWVIHNASYKSFKPFFNVHISKDAM